MSTYDLPDSARRARRVDAGRYGQLTFTSYDGDGGAGWQVKQTRGLTQPEIELLRGGIDARVDAGVDLPRFPSPDMLESFPRRLVFDADPQRYGDGAMAWWHHAPAGLDGSGRPGNVFAHILLDRGSGAPLDAADPSDPSGPAGHSGQSGPGDIRRPIDWWRSTDWLTPYGPEAVRDALLPAYEPMPGQAISADRVVDFLLDFDDYRRLSVLRVLVDACAAALAGGPAVVLTTENTDKAALWIAAVSYLTSAATARCLSFSTLERPDSLANRLQQGVRLCCAPAQDHDRLADPARGYVLLADDRDLRTGDLGGEPHRTAAGDIVAVTEWSTLSRVILLDSLRAPWALRRIGEIGSAAPPSPRLPGWPLAMLVAAHQEEFADGVASARRVVSNTPDAARADQLSAARAFVEQEKLGADDAWELLTAATHPGQLLGGMAEQVLGIYVTQAVGDIDRLAQPGGPPLPQASWRGRSWITDSVLSAIDTAARGLSERADRIGTDPATDVTGAAALLGLATLTWRLDLLANFTAGLRYDAQQLVWPVLTSAAAMNLLASAGPVPEPVMAQIVRPAAPDQINQRALGHGLDYVVVSWLYPDGMPTARAQLGDRLRVELAYQSWFVDPTANAGQRALAVSGALWLWQNRRLGPDPGELADLFSQPQWAARELSAVEAVTPDLLPARLFGPAIKSSPPGAELDTLIEQLRSRRGTEYFDRYGIGDLAELRRLTQHRWWLDGDLGSKLERVLAGGIAGLAYPSAAFDHDSVQTLQTAMLIATALGFRLDEVERLIGNRAFRPGLARPGVLPALSQTTGRGVSIAHLATAAMVGEPRFPARTLQRPAYLWAAGVRVDSDGDRIPVLRACLVAQAEANAVSIDTAYGLVRRRIADLFRESGSNWQIYATTDKYALGWLKTAMPGDGWFGRRR